MDLRLYYQKIKDNERAITGPSAVIVSHETPEGGKPGVRTEVLKQVAARMLVESRARLATPEEAREFHEQNDQARRQAEQLAEAARMQITVVPASEIRNAKSGARGSKE